MRGRRLGAVGACGIVVAGVVAVAPPSGAVPGDPEDGCVTHTLFDICDGPVRDDNTFQRCRKPHNLDLGLPVKRHAKCWVVDLGDPEPTYGDGPQNHID